jgi:putative ABC transport system permease protein
MNASFSLLAACWTGQWRASPARALTAIIAIAIGVALALGIHLVNRSALDEFGTAISVVNGNAQLQLQASDGSFDEAWYPELMRSPGVAAASPVIEAEVQVALNDRASAPPVSLKLLGLDLMRAASVTPSLLPSPDPTDSPSASGGDSPLFADDSIFLSPAAREALAVRNGDTVVIWSGLHQTRLRVAGGIPGAAAGQRLAVMDIGTLQWRLGWLGRLSRIDLRLEPGLSAERAIADFARRLPASLRLVKPDDAQQRMSNLSRAYRVNLNVLALVALFTGGFIVYSTMSLAMLRQLPELALIGVLGGTRRLLAGMMLGQGLALGGIGSMLGVLGGFGLAWAMLALLGGDLGGGYFSGARPTLSIDPLTVSIFALLGVGVGLAGSALPARVLHQIEPARALRSGSPERGLAGRHASLWALILLAIGTILLMLPPIGGLPIAAYLAIAAWLMAGIAFVPVLTASLGKLMQSRGFGSGQPSRWLALERIAGAPASAAAAMSGVVASVALASAMTIMVHSFRDSVSQWLDTVLPADVYGRAPGGLASGALGPELQKLIGQMQGIERVEFLRIVDLTLDSTRPPVALLARDLDANSPGRQLPVTGEILQPPPGATPIPVSEAMVDLYAMRPGQLVQLPLATRPGQQAGFFVASVWRDYARQSGAIMIARDDWRRLTGDASANNVALWLAPQADPDAVVRELQQRHPELHPMEFSTASAIRQLSLKIFDRSFALTYVLEAIAIVVGLFGVATTFAGEALARRREFGMLRHLGLTRRQIMRTFATEAATLTGIALLWGGLIGMLIAMVLIHRVNPQSFHWTMDTAWPFGLLGASAFTLLTLGVLAAVLASQHATSADPVRAVREDW